MMTAKQASKKFDVSLSLIYEWCRRMLPHYRIGKGQNGGKILLYESDLNHFFKERRIEPTIKKTLPRPMGFRHLDLLES
jgi:hypothetical protein